MKKIRKNIGLLTLLALGIGTSTTWGFENSFAVNQVPSKDFVEMGFSDRTTESRMDRPYAVGLSQQRRTLTLGYVIPLNQPDLLDDNSTPWQLRIGTEFQSRVVKVEGANRSSEIVGLSDLTANVKGGTIFEAFTLVYGTDFSVSPAEAHNPTLLQNGEISTSAANNFSGQNMLAPFIGIESYVNRKVAVGGRLLAEYWDSRREDSKPDVFYWNPRANKYTDGALSYQVARKSSLAVEGFCELPAFKMMDIGLTAGMNNLDRGLFRGNSAAEIYSSIHLDKESALRVSFGSHQYNSDDTTENTNFVQLGYNKRL
jgi:hypothetical protein